MFYPRSRAICSDRRTPKTFLFPMSPAATPMLAQDGRIYGRKWVYGLRMPTFREGAPRRGLEGFIGTEVAQYRARTEGGLRLISVESNVAQRPQDQPPVSKLIPAAIARYRYHRFVYQVIFRSKGETRGAVLLGGGSIGELEQLGARLLTDPESVCSGPFVHCAVFPEACSVALEMEIFVNGAPRTILWGSLLTSVAAQPRRIALLRRYAGHLVPVKIDPADANALRLPLLPGDRLNWE